MKLRLLKTLFLCTLFSVLCMPGASAADANLVQKNAFAYNVRVTSTDPQKPVVSYQLSGLASKVVVKALVDGTVVATNTNSSPATTEAAQTVTFDLTGKASGTVTFTVEVTTKKTVSSITQVTGMSNMSTNTSGGTKNLVKFYSPFGVSVNNCTDSKNFGRIAVTESEDYTSSSSFISNKSDAGDGGGAGLYILTPQCKRVTNGTSGVYGSKGGITTSSGKKTHFRVKFSDDGRLFMTSTQAGQKGLYEWNESFNTATNVLKGTADGTTGVITNSSGTTVGGIGTGLDVFGSGSDLTIALGSSTTTSSGTKGTQSLYYYKLGTATTWNTAPTSSFPSTTEYSEYFLRPMTTNVVFDPSGLGMFYSNRCDEPSKTDYNLAHFKYESATTLTNNFRSWLHLTDNAGYIVIKNIDAMAYNKDRTILAVACRYLGNLSPTIRFYKLSGYDDGKNPTWTQLSDSINIQTDVVTSDGNNFINAMAFDYAGNLFCVNNSLEGMSIYQLPTSCGGLASTTVPSMTSQSFTRKVTVSGPTNIQASNITTGSTPSACSVTISWDAATADQDKISYYEVARRIADGTYEVLKAKCTSTSYTDTSIPSWGLFYYRIRAYASDGTAGDYKYLSSAANYGSGVIFTEPTPAKVTGVSATSAAWSGTNQTTTVSWSAATQASSYNVYVNGTLSTTTTSKSATVNIATTTGAATSITVSGVNSSGTEGSKSSAVSVYNAGFGTLAAPTATVAGYQTSAATVSVSWSAPTYGTVSSYTLYRDGTAIYSGTATSYSDAAASWGSHTYNVVSTMAQKLATSASNLNVNTVTSSSTSVTVTEPAPAAVTNLAAGTASWNSGAQQATITWTASGNSTSYNVYVNGTKMTSTSGTSATVSLPMTGSAVTIAVTGVNSSGTEGAKASIKAYNAGFGTMTLTSAEWDENPTGCQNAILKWTKPTYGTVKSYSVYRVTGDGLTLVKSGIAATDLTYTDTNIGSSSNTYRVCAVMNESVALSASETGVNTAYSSPDITVEGKKDIYVRPIINSVTTYEGRDVALVSWQQEYSGVRPDYYVVHRDGITVQSQTILTSFNDTMIPDGTHVYTVTAVYSNGTELTSDPYTSPAIAHVADKTGYAIADVYNYPIYTDDESTDENAVYAQGDYVTFKAAVGAYGLPGDVYRQGTYHDGVWYIAQMTDTPIDTSTGYIPNPASSGTTQYDQNGTYKGGILRFNADDPRTGATRDPELVSWENQSIAVDDNGNLITRYGGKAASEISYGSGSASDKYLFHFPVSNVKVTRSSGSTNIDVSSLGFLSEYSGYKDSSHSQYYRTHYMSANGNASSTSGANLYLAMNQSADVWKININSANGYSAQVFRPDGYSEHQTISNTENYAFPMPTEIGGFIQQIRSNVVYYVDEQGTYTKLYTEDLDTKNVGGSAFVYDGRVFILHPTSTASKNIGNFRVDMAHKADKSANVNTSDMSILIPMVTYDQNEIVKSKSSGGVSANWFGAEAGTYTDPNTNEVKDCVYVYQYVPGVRFAKYRFYSYETPATPTPTLEIKTVYTQEDGENVDIDRYVAELTWTRTKDDYNTSEDYHLDHYEAELLDNNLNVIATETITVDASKKDETETYTVNFGTDGSNFAPTEDNESNGTIINNATEYTARLTPVYINDKNEKLTVTTETNAAQGDNDYSVAMGEVSVKTFATRTNNNYRVDIDFNKADLLQLQSADGEDAKEEPISYFKVRVHKPGMSDGEFEDIPDLMICIGGTRVLASELQYKYTYGGDDAYEEQIVPGTYKFTGDASSTYALRKGKRYILKTEDNSEPAENCGDKNYALSGLHEGDADPVVAFYWTTENPVGNSYSVEAVYAASNTVLTKTVASSTESVTSNITTDNLDIALKVDGLTVYPIPASIVLHVQAAQEMNRIDIYATNGALVKRFEDIATDDAVLDISDIASGNYILHVSGYSPLHFIKK